jgi:hypothetical protein
MSTYHGSIPRRRVVLTWFVLCCCLAGTSGGWAQQTKFTVTAGLWKYEKLCDPNEWLNHASQWAFEAPSVREEAAFEFEACAEEGKTVPHPQVVRVAFVNSGESDLKISIDGLADVVLRDRTGRQTPVTAICVPVPRMMSGNRMTMKAAEEAQVSEPPRILVVVPRTQTEAGGFSLKFVTRMKGRLTATVLGGQSGDLFLLFPAAKVGDSIKIGKLAPVRITQ